MDHIVMVLDHTAKSSLESNRMSIGLHRMMPLIASLNSHLSPIQVVDRTKLGDVEIGKDRDRTRAESNPLKA